MKHGCIDPGSDEYMSQEALLNEIKRVKIKNGSERALAVAVVDKTGESVSSFFKAKNITSAGTHKLDNHAGYLGSIVVNKPLTGTVTVYDSKDASGEKIATLSGVGSQVYNCRYENGLTIVTSASEDITVLRA